MLRFSVAVCIGLLLPVSAFAGLFQNAHEAYVRDHIYPRLDSLHESAQAMAEVAGDKCDDEKGQVILRKAFINTNTAWQAFQHIRIGALTDFDQVHRLQFWPDKRNKVGKAKAKLEKQQAEGGAINQAKLYNGSVAAQGFPLLERYLFDDQVVFDVQTCQIIQAVSANIVKVSNDLFYAWQGDEGYGAELMQTMEVKDLYTDEVSVASDLLGNTLTALQWVEDVKIRSALRDGVTKARYKRMENWRSQQSFSNLYHNVEALQESYHILYQSTIAELEGGSVRNGEINEAFDESLAILKALKGRSETVIQEQEMWDQLLKVAQQLRIVRAKLFEIAKPLGLAVGFNSLDGD